MVDAANIMLGCMILVSLGSVFAGSMFFITVQMRIKKVNETIDRIQQLIIVARLAADELESVDQALFAAIKAGSAAKSNFLLSCCGNIQPKNVVEGYVFYLANPKVTSTEIIDLILSEASLYDGEPNSMFLRLWKQMFLLK